MYTKLEAFVEISKYKAIPSRIDVSASERIASPLDVWTTVVEHLYNPKVLGFLLFAVAADLLAAYLASGVFARNEAVNERQKKYEAFKRIDSNDVSYIWVPETHPDKYA